MFIFQNVKNIKKKERREKSEPRIINNKAFTEEEDSQIYLFVFNQLEKGIAKERLKLGSFDTWKKLQKSSGINRTAPSLKQRFVFLNCNFTLSFSTLSFSSWSDHLRSLERLVELDEVPDVVKEDLRKAFIKA
ncbi:hypothetical protein CAEBREN_25337 [Caenorhabditis brenneri]|uniref:Uncharacterized protein n=1 Tax=Caenorhabditis brenneri TaxID=135651 RepID=G0P1I3_CAEBE|nr:hypothetical protein CAEBREN_25337 [Caenorhabditis brenneri]